MLIYPLFKGKKSPLVVESLTAHTCSNNIGQKIRWYWAQGNPDADVVLLCHGHCADHTSFSRLLAFLQDAGFSLLMLDFRAHGKSEGKITGIGLCEGNDIVSVIRDAKSRGLLGKGKLIAAYGRSMGAASLVHAAAQAPEIDAFILESCFARLRSIAARDAWRLFGVPDTPLLDVVLAIASWRTGISYSKNNPVEKAGDIGTRPVLLIHDELDPRATLATHKLWQAALTGEDEWIVPGAGHVKAFSVKPKEFRRKFLSFLAKAGLRSNYGAASGTTAF